MIPIYCARKNQARPLARPSGQRYVPHMAASFLTLLLILAGTALAVTTLLAVIYWYEAVNEPAKLFVPCEKTRLRCAALGFLTSLASQTLVAATFLQGYLPSFQRPGPEASRARPSRPAVIFIHGLYHNPGAWFRFKRFFRRAGYERLYLPRYNSYGRKTFDEIAVQIKGYAAAVIASQGPVILIGHSMGGLLIRSLLADPDIAKSTLAAVTLGTPHQGSKLAALAFGAAGRDIIFHSPLITRLAKAPCPASLPKLSLFSPMDDMVLPLAALDPPTKDWTLEATAPVSHVYMLYHAPIIRRVLQFLKVKT